MDPIRLPDNLDEIALHDDPIPRDQRQVRHLRRRDDRPIKTIAMKSESMRFRNDVQVERCQINAAARNESSRPMLEWLAQLDSPVLDKNGDFPEYGRGNDDQGTIGKGLLENLDDTLRKTPMLSGGVPDERMCVGDVDSQFSLPLSSGFRRRPMPAAGD